MAISLSYLMETVANGHTFMSPMQSYYMTAKALQSLTLEEVNKAASDLCSHITGFKEGCEGAEGVSNCDCLLSKDGRYDRPILLRRGESGEVHLRSLPG